MKEQKEEIKEKVQVKKEEPITVEKKLFTALEHCEQKSYGRRVLFVAQQLFGKDKRTNEEWTRLFIEHRIV